MKYVCESESFEEYIRQFRKSFSYDDSYIVWGGEEKAKKVIKKLSNILFLVDNDKKKWGMKLGGLEIKPPDVLNEYKNTKIVVAVHAYIDVNKQLDGYGIPEENYCHYSELLIIEDYFRNGVISVPEITFMINNRCTLSCKGCIEYIPYIKKQQDFPFQQIRDSFDVFFRYVDYCEDISLVGGEALLHKELGSLLEYLFETYVSAGHAKTIKITTNATVIPNESILKILKIYNIVVVMSDYKSAIGDRCVIDKLIVVFQQWEIKYQIENHFSRVDEGKWFDMGNPLRARGMTERELMVYFNKCTVICPSIWDSKLFNCNGVRSNIMNLVLVRKCVGNSFKSVLWVI